FSEIKHGGNKWIRVEDLAAFGEFLNLTSDPTDIIASPEVATIMYFAKRDVLDLLGVANTDIARAPLNPLSPGNILHRRRNPKTIYDRKPEFIAFYGCESRTYFDFHKAGSEKLVKFIEESSFTDVKAGIALYRGGSMRRLLNLGYRNLTVFLGHGYFNYFVSAPAYQRHIERLESLGLRSLGELSVKVPSTESMEKLFPDPI
ncbi:MAG: hypothetical protein KDD35_08895, partial [Bdellovibrionales bacterium]|nr:hypothetical protein [Bdellovibrionales bacterium]